VFQRGHDTVNLSVLLDKRKQRRTPGPSSPVMTTCDSAAVNEHGVQFSKGSGLISQRLGDLGQSIYVSIGVYAVHGLAMVITIAHQHHRAASRTGSLRIVA